MISDYISLAIHSLSHRRLRSWLTMIGIFIGIAAVVSLIGLGEGLRTAITSQFGFLGSDVLSIQASGLNYGPPGSGAITPLTDDLAEKIERVGGVEAAFNRQISSAKAEFNDRQEIVFTATMPVGDYKKILENMLNLRTYSGRLLRDSDSKGVVLGYGYSEDETFGKGIKSGDRLIINGQSFSVVGILMKKGSFILDNTILMNEDTFLDLFGNKKGTSDVIAVKVKNVDEIDRVQESIEKLLRKERGVKKGEEDFTVQSPQKTIETLNSALFAVQLFVYIIASISLVVGGIGIMNTMYTSVLERTREIGIMKAIGARNSTIFTMFFFESGFLGMVGGIIGIIIGLSLAYGLAFIGKMALGSDLIQANVSFGLLIGALLFSFILGTAFGVLPALNASRLQPVDALRSK